MVINTTNTLMRQLICFACLLPVSPLWAAEGDIARATTPVAPLENANISPPSKMQTLEISAWSEATTSALSPNASTIYVSRRTYRWLQAGRVHRSCDEFQLGPIATDAHKPGQAYSATLMKVRNVQIDDRCDFLRWNGSGWVLSWP